VKTNDKYYQEKAVGGNRSWLINIISFSQNLFKKTSKVSKNLNELAIDL
jgi:hypothetical protein